MGSYFFFDMTLTTVRKREREAVLPEEMPFIKADKTNRASFPVVMVLKASLIILVGFIPLWALLDNIHKTEEFIFLNFSTLLNKTTVKLVSWIWDILLLVVFSFPLQTLQCDFLLMVLIYLDNWIFQSSWVKTERISTPPPNHHHLLLLNLSNWSELAEDILS